MLIAEDFQIKKQRLAIAPSYSSQFQWVYQSPGHEKMLREKLLVLEILKTA